MLLILIVTIEKTFMNGQIHLLRLKSPHLMVLNFAAFYRLCLLMVSKTLLNCVKLVRLI